MKKDLIAALLCAMLIVVFGSATAQIKNVTTPDVGVPTQPPPQPGPISGPTTVAQGHTYSYSVTPVSGAGSYVWALSSPVEGSVIGTSNIVSITFSATYTGSAQIYCAAQNSIGTSMSSILTVTVTGATPLTAGTISPASQTISYNKVPAILTCSAPTGGSGGYTYQWQSSPNNMIWTNISGATGLNYSPGALTATAWYQLVITSGTSSATTRAAMVNVNPGTNPSNLDTTFTTAMNHVFANLSTAKVPYGLLRDYGMEFVNLENFNGVALTDSNYVDQGTFNQVYTTLATARMTTAAVTTLPSPNKVDSTWFVSRQPGQVTVAGLYYQYSYLASNADSTGKITVSNGQVTDKYVSGVWQNPYLTGQAVAFAPSTAIYNTLNFNILMPASLWLTNSASLVSSIQIDAGDGSGYRTLTPGTALPVMYSDTGLKTWNFKLILTNGTTLQSHAQIEVRGAVSKLICYSAGCGVYTPPGGGSGGTQVAVARAGTVRASVPVTPDLISGQYPYYLFTTGATYNGASASGLVTVQLGSGHSTFVNPLIIVEGFDYRKYTAPEDDGEGDLNGFLDSVATSGSTALYNSIVSSATQYDLVYVTFKNGTDDMHRNALLVESVIRWVNGCKTGTAKNAVLGLSMGGVLARYALSTMENNGETHQVGLLVCQGSPQQGAEVPVSLQDFETHANSLYMKAGPVAGIYDFIRMFFPSAPDIDGILTLSNTPAAQQMLITHINSNYQMDNSVHLAWEKELAALPYPSQGGIKVVAISNGSECGQPQTLGQGASLLYYDGKLSTTFLGDVIVGVGTDLTKNALTGQPALSLAAIPGRNSIYAHFALNAAVNGGGNQVYNGKITYTKTILWLIPITSTLTNVTLNAPSGPLAYETFAGDYISMPNDKSFASKGWFGKYNITVNIAPTFGFIPVPSVLDIGKGNTTLVAADYATAYTETTPPATGSKASPFSNFITAYGPTQSVSPGSTGSVSTAVNNNEYHLQLETRDCDWLAAELQGNSPLADCSNLCASTAITGDPYICSNTVVYSATSYSNVSYLWSVGPNLQISGSKTNPTVSVLSPNGVPGTTSWLECDLTVNTPNSGTSISDCGTQKIRIPINIGVQPLVVTSTVDRTPQADDYQYVTATANQISGATASNYQWYLVVNGQPTTLIGTGLVLSHYPIAPCSTVYYECQVTTPCGVTTFNGYAYNTTCNQTSVEQEKTVVIYPNPGNKIMIVMNKNIPIITGPDGNPNGLAAQSYQVKVYDVKGTVIRSVTSESGNQNVSFDTTDIPNGNYFVHIIQGSNVIEKQIIVQH